MNDNFTNGFIKAAQANGLSDEQIQYLLKKAADPAAMAAMAAGAPPQEDPNALPQGAGLEEAAAGPAMPPEAAGAQPNPAEALEGLGGGEEGGHGDIDQLLAQLSPEELEQLASELAGDIGGAQSGAPEAEGQEDPELHQLAQAIADHLQQNPDASLPAGEPDGDEGAGMPPEAAAGLPPEAAAGAELPPEEDPAALLAAKSSALNYVKSAEYVEGFLSRAVEHGVNVKEAVDMYDNALVTTINTLSDPSYVVDTTQTKQAASTEVDEKTAAYFEGVVERAREYGLDDKTAFELVYEELEKNAAGFDGLGKGMQQVLTGAPKATVSSGRSVLPAKRPAGAKPKAFAGPSPTSQTLNAAQDVLTAPAAPVVPPTVAAPKVRKPRQPRKPDSPADTALKSKLPPDAKAAVESDPGLWDLVKQKLSGGYDATMGFGSEHPGAAFGIGAGAGALGAGALAMGLSGGHDHQQAA